MFEKEAKERARTLEERQTLGVYDDDESYARDLGWNEGEVAGYEEGFKDGAEFGYNKANEWHDLRKDPNDLPDTHCLNWVIALYDNGTLWCRAKREKCVDGIFWVDSYHYQIYNVIAWKEITLPKEIEENENKFTLTGHIVVSSLCKSAVERIAELEKENAQLKSKNCWKTCEYAEPKSQWISQHIQDVVQLTKAKEIIKDFILIAKVEHLKDRYETVDEADQFLNSEVEK